MSRRARWTLAITSIALFMTTLDNLVVSTALPSIRRSLGASIESLEWTVNAATLSFAVLPLTWTLLSEAVDESQRGLALGIWSGVAGLGVALGPLVGGLVVDGFSWEYIFWLNVPVGLALMPFAARRLDESYGPDRHLDLPGLALAGGGLLGVVYGIVRGQALGWTSATIVASIAVGLLLLAAFVAWELRAKAPMLPMRLFKSRGFAATNGVSLAMFFGAFGSIFLLAQFFQTAQGYSPLEAGLRTLPWTAMPIFVAPVAGILSDRIGSRPLMASGLALQSIAITWLAIVSDPTTAYSSLIIPFVLAGTGMALVFAPAANAVLGSVAPAEAGKASGATNAIREVGGVLGVAVLASVFSANGSYATPAAFSAGMSAALPVGAAVLAVGALVALLVPGKERRAVERVGAAEPVAA